MFDDNYRWSDADVTLWDQVVFGGESGYCTPEPVPGDDGQTPAEERTTDVVISDPATDVDVLNNQNCAIGLLTSTPTNHTAVTTRQPPDIQHPTTALRYARGTTSNVNVVNTGSVDNSNQMHRQLVARVNYLTHQARNDRVARVSLDSELSAVKALLTTLVVDVGVVKANLVNQNLDVKSMVSLIREVHNIGTVDWNAMGRAILGLKETLRL